MSETAGGAPTEHIYDVVVLGAGPVGVVLAERTRAAALSVAVVERELVGGECQYWACIPSKALLRPVVAVADACRVQGAWEAVNGPVDSAATFARRDGFVTHWQDDGPAGLVKGFGAELVRGHGRLDGPRRVAVDTLDHARVVLSARHAVAVCTGSRAAVPDLPGIAEAGSWISRDATSASAVPERLAIVGSGPVGGEMSTAWQGLGASVTCWSKNPARCAGWSPSWVNWSPAGSRRLEWTFAPASLSPG
jgi:pyruvate/2-oxoglutarate dehydrogenase complex dihydrolipoamide dehydrogenase (E3) component